VVSLSFGNVSAVPGAKYLDDVIIADLSDDSTLGKQRSAVAQSKELRIVDCAKPVSLDFWGATTSAAQNLNTWSPHLIHQLFCPVSGSRERQHTENINFFAHTCPDQREMDRRVKGEKLNFGKDKSHSSPETQRVRTTSSVNQKSLYECLYIIDFIHHFILRENKSVHKERSFN
jgi:hypothetical protein